VSVVMAAYNSGEHLAEAVDSVLAQTFTDFELIIIDDGSTDDTAAILNSYGDRRIVRLVNERNLGPAGTCSRGLHEARGEYVANIDADDVWEPSLLLRQVEQLNAHKEITVAATWSRIIQGDTRTEDMWRPSPNRGVLAWELTWNCPISHSSVVMRRRDILAVGSYCTKSRFAPDYELWTRVVKAGKIISILPEPLAYRRLWSEQVTKKYPAEQLRAFFEATYPYLEWLLGRTIDREQVRGMMSLYQGRNLGQGAKIESCIALAREVEQRCGELYGGADARKIRDRVSDALIFGAAGALQEGKRQQARDSILYALRHHPWRAARPWTFQLLASSCVRSARSSGPETVVGGRT
jgi:glycosyltransferase involved in cell wall biosynthesis